MKKMVSILLLCVLVFGFSACGGNVENVAVGKYASKIYSDQEIEDAIDVAIRYFQKEFTACTLTEITYRGDQYLDDYQEFADRNNADDVIVLISSFDVAETGADGCFNAGTTYRHWNWILVRDDGGKWRHVDHGYG